MPTSRALKVTLPHDMAEMVKAKVEAGEYASESDVVRAGLQALQSHDTALDHWLRTEVLAGHQEYLADPTSAVPADHVLERVITRYRARQSKAR